MAILNSKRIMVKLADGTLIKGSITTKGKLRASDLFNETDDQFVIMFDIASKEPFGEVLFINKNQIVWVAPLD